MALRATSAEALDAPGRRDRGRRARGSAGTTATTATARAYRFHDPDGHVMEVLWESDRYVAPEHLRARRCATSRSATRRAARRSSASTTSTCSRATSRPAARFATDVLGYRHYEGIVLDNGERDRRLAEPHDRRPRADLRRGRARGGRAPAPPRVLGRHARGVPAGGRHLPRQRRPHRGRAVAPRGRRGLLPLLVRAGRQPHRGHHRRLLRLRARRRAADVDRGRARARPGVGRQDRGELPLLRHAADRRGPRLRARGWRRRA